MWLVVAEQCEAGQTAADYDSRSLMQFSKSHQLLLGAYELLSQQNASTAGSQLAASSFAECAIKSVSTSLYYLAPVLTEADMWFTLFTSDNCSLHDFVCAADLCKT